MVNLIIYDVLDLMKYSRCYFPCFPDEKTDSERPSKRPDLVRWWMLSLVWHTGSKTPKLASLLPPGDPTGGDHVSHTGKVKPQMAGAEKLPGNKLLLCTRREVSGNLALMLHSSQFTAPHSSSHNLGSAFQSFLFPYFCWVCLFVFCFCLPNCWFHRRVMEAPSRRKVSDSYIIFSFHSYSVTWQLATSGSVLQPLRLVHWRRVSGRNTSTELPGQEKQYYLLVGTVYSRSVLI